MPLAPQVANPGSRGQDSRYKFDPTFMYVGPDGRITDGTYHYSGDPEAMLADDRPSVALGGLPPADDSDSMYAYSASLRPGAGVPRRPGAPTGEIQMGMMIPGGSTPGDPQMRSTGDWSDPLKGEAAQNSFRDFLVGQMATILKKNPGLYENEADYMGDINAYLAGDPSKMLARNEKQVRYVPTPSIGTPPPEVKNPYGTLGPSPQRIRNIQGANPYGGLGVSPQRIANVDRAGQSMAPGFARPLGGKPIPAAKIPMRPAPTPVKKAIVPIQPQTKKPAVTPPKKK